jgi:predicted Fe-Mo cluster-binding NifX family protein
MISTRIAIGTADGKSVSEHLARSAAFIVLEIENGAVVSRAVRNRFNSQCSNHATFLELLSGCNAAICGGISQSAWDLLVSHGIQPVVLGAPMAVEDALAGYLAGTLGTTSERVCLCH